MWHLVLLDAQGKEVQRHPISAEALTIGRGKDRHIALPSTAVSRRHAQVLLRDGRPTLVDEGSANGTRLNGQPLRRPAPLADGDEIAIAGFRLRVQGLPAAAPAAAAASMAAPGDSALLRSASELLQQQMAGIRSYRSESGDDADRRAAEFEQAWTQVIASLRELQQQLRSDARVMYFTIDRDASEVNIKLADPRQRGGGLLLSLSRRPPEGQAAAQCTVWLRAFGEREATFAEPQLALERLVQRIAGRLA